MLAYWGINLTLLAVESWLPGLIRHLKTQHNKYITRAELWKLLKRVVTNQLLLLLPALGLSLLIKRVKAVRDRVRPHFQQSVDRPLPSLKRVACETAFSLGVGDGSAGHESDAPSSRQRMACWLESTVCETDTVDSASS